MKKFFFLLVFLVITADTWAQFRRSRGTESASENSLNYANPAEYTIAGIDVTGLNVLDKNAMISLTGLKIGDKIKIPGDAITQAIRNLWKHGLVGDVTIQVDKVEGSDVYLNIVLAERPRLTDFFFTGINKSQESGLKEDLTLIRGKIVNDAMIRNTELAVKKYFVKKGFLNAEVKIHQQKDTLNRDGIRLKIVVNPKSKVKINAISFTGNDNVDDVKLKKKMKGTHERPKFALHRTLMRELLTMNHKEFLTSSKPVTWKETKEFLNDNVKLNLFVTSKFVQSDYEDDKNKVVEYFNSKGYRDAEIVSDTIYAHDNRTFGPVITFTPTNNLMRFSRSAREMFTTMSSSNAKSPLIRKASTSRASIWMMAICSSVLFQLRLPSRATRSMSR
jgi:outer membrane protein insertion porin family